MNDSIERSNIKRGRGVGKKEALLHVNLRMSNEVLMFYKKYSNYTGKMREVLTNFMKENR